MNGAVERATVERFRTWIATRFGLSFDENRLDFLADILRKRADAIAHGDRVLYLELLTRSLEARSESRVLAADLTVGETYFFRYFDHFRAFGELVLPERIAARRPERVLRVLSAGCASGEEPYSLALAVRERAPALFASAEIAVCAIDLNPDALARAARGRYSSWALRETPADQRERWFRPEGREFAIDEEIRGRVRFEERNLLEDDPLFWAEAAFDVIFCRNVIMYFGVEAAQRVVGNIARALAPGGYLFLGHAETLRGLSQDFHLCHSHGTFYYQRKTAGLSPAPSREEAAPAVASAWPILDPNTSWVEAVRNATERITRLTDQAARTRTTVPGPPAHDLARAHDLLRAERFGDAIAELHAMPPQSQTDPDARLLRAVLLTNTGRLAEAEEMCRALLAIDELHAGAHYVTALCREHAGDRTGALEHDQTAVYLDGNFAMPHLHQGLLAKRAGDPDSARRALERALALFPREDAARILLFGGGFTRESLIELCRSELNACGGAP